MSPLLLLLLAAPAGTDAGPRFVLAGERLVGVSREAGQTQLGTDSGPRLGGDVVLGSGLSLGLAVQPHWSAPSAWSTNFDGVFRPVAGSSLLRFGLTPRVGFLLELTDHFALWPRLGVTWSRMVGSQPLLLLAPELVGLIDLGGGAALLAAAALDLPLANTFIAEGVSGPGQSHLSLTAGLAVTFGGPSPVAERSRDRLSGLLLGVERLASAGREAVALGSQSFAAIGRPLQPRLAVDWAFDSGWTAGAALSVAWWPRPAEQPLPVRVAQDARVLLAPRIGYLLGLTDALALWPRLGVVLDPVGHEALSRDVLKLVPELGALAFVSDAVAIGVQLFLEARLLEHRAILPSTPPPPRSAFGFGAAAGLTLFL